MSIIPGGSVGSRVAKRGATGDISQLARLLREGRRAKDYTPLLGYLRGLTPSRLDGELRAMQVPCLPNVIYFS